MTSYVYVGTYDTAGRSAFTNYDYNGPLYNQSAFTPVSPDIITEIITRLPEGVDNYTANPTWRKDGDFLLTAPTTMKITFLFDGAGGNLNTLGYYFYDSTTTTITTASDITTIYILYPNCSQTGGGGIYNAGDSMLLGSAFSTTVISGLTIGTPTNFIFPTNTKIGLVLIQNAWNPGTATVSTGNLKFYTTSILNSGGDIYRFNFQSVTNPAFIITSFEDILYTAGSDGDVNDVIVLVIPETFSAIDTSTINLASQFGGDPYVKTLGGTYTNIPIGKDITLAYLENSNTIIDIKIDCQTLSYNQIVNKNKYHRHGNGYIRPINLERESYYLNAIFITKLNITFIHNNITKTLSVNTIDLEILDGDLEYNIITPKDGLYSIKYQKNYKLTPTTKQISITLLDYKINIKTDIFWDESNEITFYTDSLRQFTKIHGYFIDKKDEKN